MVHHARKRVRPILPLFESDGELRLVVLGIVVPVGLHGDVGPVGSGAAGGLVTGERGCGEGEEGEGEDLEAHFGLGGVSGARGEEIGEWYFLVLVGRKGSVVVVVVLRSVSVAKLLCESNVGSVR